MGVQNFMKCITKKLVFLQNFISVVMLFSLLTLIFVQVILRYVLNLPLMGIEELMLFPIIWLYMLGAANASEERSHIVVDIADTFIKNLIVKKVIEIIKNLLSVAIGIVLAYWCFNFFQYSLNLWKYSPLLSLPMFLAESALFIGVLLMALYSISDLIKSIRQGIHSDDSQRKEGVL